jgi:hypothetical protein
LWQSSDQGAALATNCTISLFSVIPTTHTPIPCIGHTQFHHHKEVNVSFSGLSRSPAPTPETELRSEAALVGRTARILNTSQPHVRPSVRIFFWWDCGLNSGLHACKAGALCLSSTSIPFYSGCSEGGVLRAICLS